MPLNGDDYIGLLSSEEETLPSFSVVDIAEEGKKNGSPLPGNIEKVLPDWKDDTVTGKVDKIRAVILSAKTPVEVYTAAATMPIGDWLELVLKLAPKDIKVSGDVNFKHMLADLGPIDKNEYRPRLLPKSTEDNIIDVVAEAVTE